RRRHRSTPRRQRDRQGRVSLSRFRPGLDRRHQSAESGAGHGQPRFPCHGPLVRVGINYKFDPLATVYDAPLAAKGLALDKAPIVTAWSWAGPYLGVNYGYGWGKSNTDTVLSDASSGAALIATNMSAKLDGMTFGGQAGFNWQSGPWVSGIEADFQQSRQRGRAATLNCSTSICNPAISAFGLDAPVRGRMAQKLEGFGTLR